MNSIISYIVLCLALEISVVLNNKGNVYGFDARKSNTDHPMLFFDSKDVQQMITKSKTSHKKITVSIKEAGESLKERPDIYLPPESFEKFGSKWNEQYGNNLCAFAMYCLLFPDDDEAFRLVTLQMDRMTSYPDWYVTSSRKKDEVPIGHSLTGYAIAFDFLYSRFNSEQRQRYLTKVKLETAAMYHIANTHSRGWMRQHIHNHAATNLVSILLGALVTEVHDKKKGEMWKELAKDLLDKAMHIWQMVTDGSNDEGVAYGTYSSRGWIQYIFLATRHFNIDYSQNAWLRQHFWFYFATILPGYDRTVGIADSNHNWFHGPLSQLVFLDNYVMRNGYGNWLANKIRDAMLNTSFSPSISHRWSTTYLEFIFYNDSIKPVRPVLDQPFHIFHDWGVVTYGGGQENKPGNTFLSFKSGALNGEGVATIVEDNMFSDILRIDDEDLGSWRNFNPGHEHPDQNSFVFAPNGRYFITESLYSTKYSHLNNILAFAPSTTSHCNAPWEGQVGECSKWLNYKHIPVPRGRIVTTTYVDGMMHIAGEAVDAYSPALGLESVQRSLVLLQPDVLVVVDNIYLQEDAELTRCSAYFNNIMEQFKSHEQAGYQGAKVDYPEGSYQFVWFQPDGNSPKPTLHQEVIPCEYGTRTTHYVNLTFPLIPSDVTRMAYVFYGPDSVLKFANFNERSNYDVTYLTIDVNDVKYELELASTMTSLARRMKLFGFGGYLRLRKNDTDVLFGYNDDQNDKSYNMVSHDLSVGVTITSSKHNSVAKRKIDKTSFTTNYPSTIYLFFVCYLLCCYCKIKQRRYLTSCSREFRFCVGGIFALWIIILLYLLRIHFQNENIFAYVPPTVIITSLPGSGAETLKMIFQNSTDFIYLSSDDVTIPVKYDVNKFNPCYWPRNKLESFVTAEGWFRVLKTEPLSFLNNLVENNLNVEIARKRFRQAKKQSRVALNLNSGLWNSKLAWIRDKLGDEMKVIYVVRDPRDWVYSLIRDDLSEIRKLRQKDLIKNFVQRNECVSPSWLPHYFKNIEGENVVIKLAKIWRSDVLTVIANGGEMQIVRFEDLVSDPQYTATALLRHIGLTISVPQINKISRAMHSGIYDLQYEGPIHQDYPGQWKGKMAFEDLRSVEKICGGVMKTLMYL